MKIFSIRDQRAEAYNRPFFSLTRAMATREIQAGLEKDPQMIGFADDFAIFEIGEFDTDTGKIEPCDPYHVIEVRELIPKELHEA